MRQITNCQRCNQTSIVLSPKINDISEGQSTERDLILVDVITISPYSCMKVDCLTNSKTSSMEVQIKCIKSLNNTFAKQLLNQ